MKAQAKYYREIAYVVVRELPDLQQQALVATYKNADYIKILIDGMITGPCLQYTHYEAWYQDQFAKFGTQKLEDSAVKVESLVLNKA